MKFETALTTDDDRAIVELLNLYFRTKISDDDWRWYCYGRSQALNRKYVMRNSDDIVVGCYCVIPAVAIVDGAPMEIGFGNHLVIDSQYRDVLNFLKFSNFVFDEEKKINSSLLIGPPNKNAFSVHKVLAGFTDFGALHILVKAPPRHALLPESCRLVNVFSDAHSRLFSECLNGAKFYFDRSAAWLNWRYTNKPGNQYVAYEAIEDGRLAGLIVLKKWVEPSGYTKAHIMDLCAESDRALESLLVAADHFSVGLDELNLWSAAGYPYRQVLRKAGYFWRDKVTQPVIARKLCRDVPGVEEGAWVFTYGDADGY